ncbi:hypothetical protein D3C78_1111570 [compost metagenome]
MAVVDQQLSVLFLRIIIESHSYRACGQFLRGHYQIMLFANIVGMVDKPIILHIQCPTAEFSAMCQNSPFFFNRGPIKICFDAV